MVGRIVQISLSQGGVPKTAVPEAEIVATGLVGDRHSNPQIHGGPEKAVCLWSLEVIETLQAEGHNLTPGAAGENVTIAGLDWPQIRPDVPGPGIRLIGDREINRRTHLKADRLGHFGFA